MEGTCLKWPPELDTRNGEGNDDPGAWSGTKQYKVPIDRVQ